MMEAMKLTVSLLCFSNDLLKVEVISTSKQEQVVIPEAWRAWFHNEIKSDVVYVQDIVHIRVKLKAFYCFANGTPLSGIWKSCSPDRKRSTQFERT